MENILKECYDIVDAELTKLEGYHSINYKIRAKQGIFVLKQYANNMETKDLLQAENRILHRLNGLNDYDFPVPIPTQKKESVVVENGSIFRLLSYIEGNFLGDVEHTHTLLESFGRFLGKMDNVLLNTYEAAIAGKEIQWDLKHFASNYGYLNYINDAKDKSLVDYFFLQFDENVRPVQHRLRKSIIHNDANDWNVLTKEGKVSGIIDFGDMCHSWVINELAIGITYVMMDKENPLQSAQYVIKGYHDINPLEEEELEILYYLVAARLCTSVCNSAYAKTIKPESDYITISEKSAWSLLYKWLTINPIRAETSFRQAVNFPPRPKKSLDLQLAQRKKNSGNILSLSYTRPIQMERSAFQYMYDAQGNTILDAYNNIMLAGHCHPKVVRAGQRALAKLNTNTRYVYDELLVYSERLLSKFPDHLNKVFFVNSGSAASDLAIRMAMEHTKKNKIMVLEHGYHGNTRTAIEISHYKYGHKGGSGQKEHIVQTPMPKIFGSGYHDDGTAGDHFAQMAFDQIDRNWGSIAAFIAEPIVGCGGQVPLPQGYLKNIYQKMREQGGVCISDEVQVGFGRLGDFFWGYEMYDVLPDVVILGKPMGNGHPIGAVVTTTAIAESFDNGMEFFSSFGGNPVSCAIGNAVLEVIAGENLQQHAKEVGRYLQLCLRRLANIYPEIADIRGSGLFLGVEIHDGNGNPNTQLADKIKNRLRENHILIGTDGPYNNVLKIKPPLSFSKTDCDLLIERLGTILGEVLKI